MTTVGLTIHTTLELSPGNDLNPKNAEP